MEVALLNKLEFKHQVTMARREGGREGYMRALRCRGCPGDRKWDGGRGKRGVEVSRGWEGRLFR